MLSSPPPPLARMSGSSSSTIKDVSIHAFCSIISYLPPNMVVMVNNSQDASVLISDDVFLGPIFQVCALWRQFAVVNDEFWEAACHVAVPYTAIHDTAYTASTYHAMLGLKRWHLMQSNDMMVSAQYSHPLTGAAHVTMRCRRVEGDRNPNNNKNKSHRCVFLSEPIVHSQGLHFTCGAKDQFVHKDVQFVVGITTETHPDYVFNDAIIFNMASECITRPDLTTCFRICVDTSCNRVALVSGDLDVVRWASYDRLLPRHTDDEPHPRAIPPNERYPVRFVVCLAGQFAFRMKTYLRLLPLDADEHLPKTAAPVLKVTRGDLPEAYGKEQ
eukprot:PhM_4_TR14357/c0_g1_i1/m.36456